MSIVSEIRSVGCADPSRCGRYGWRVCDACGEMQDRVEMMETALREIGTPKHVPEHFDPLDFWKHTASKHGEIARDTLDVKVEELILGENTPRR